MCLSINKIFSELKLSEENMSAEKVKRSFLGEAENEREKGKERTGENR